MASTYHLPLRGTNLSDFPTIPTIKIAQAQWEPVTVQAVLSAPLLHCLLSTIRHCFQRLRISQKYLGILLMLNDSRKC